MVRLTPGDKALILFLFFLAIILLWFPISRKKGEMVIIQVEGREVGRFPLELNREMQVEGPLGETSVVIEGGEVWVRSSPCPDGRCIRMGKKWRADDLIVCLPNRVVIRITGEGEGGYDAIAQ